jgi:hypothetical protein
MRVERRGFVRVVAGCCVSHRSRDAVASVGLTKCMLVRVSLSFVLVVDVLPDLRRLRSRSSRVLEPVYSTEILFEFVDG